MKRKRVKITFTDEVLGTLPADPEIRKTYVESKAPTPEISEEEDGYETIDEKGVTVFPREDGKPFAIDYQIKGLFKGACKSLRKVAGLKSHNLRAYKTTIDGEIFVFPRKIFFEIEGEMGRCERPLRASTPQGERVALASSESIPAGSTLTFDIVCLENLHMHTVEEWLDYGFFNGFGQWRSGGKGKFTYEVVEEETYKNDGSTLHELKKIAKAWDLN